VDAGADAGAADAATPLRAVVALVLVAAAVAVVAAVVDVDAVAAVVDADAAVAAALVVDADVAAVNYHLNTTARNSDTAFINITMPHNLLNNLHSWTGPDPPIRHDPKKSAS